MKKVESYPSIICRIATFDDEMKLDKFQKSRVLQRLQRAVKDYERVLWASMVFLKE